MAKKKIKYIIFVLIIIGKDLPYHSLHDHGYNSTDGYGVTNESSTMFVSASPTLKPIRRAVTKPRPYPEVSFPPFHSNTSISKNDVRVRDPSLLECAGTHRYCINKGFNLSNVKGLYCSCQMDCHKYGDCCWDAPKPEFKGKFQGKEYLLPEWERTCVEIPTGAFNRESFYMTTGCPKNYTDNEYKKYCQQGVYPEKHHEMTNHELVVWVSRRLPVISLWNNVTYVNVFCAICNDAKKVTPWELVPVNCSYPNETMPLQDSWSEFAQANKNPSLMSLIRYCSIVYRKPEPLSITNKKIRQCDKEVKQQCLYTGTTNKTLRHQAKQCKYYYAPVEARSNNVKVKFKNKFCAFCAGFSERELNCVTGGHTLNRFKAPGVKVPAMALFFDFSLTYSGDNHDLGSSISCLNREKPGNLPELSVLLGKHKITTNWRKRCLLGSSLYEKECYSGTIEPTPPISRDNCLRIDRILTIVCLGASLVALLGKFICYLAMKRSVSLASRCVLLLAVSVFVYQLLFLMGSTGAHIPSVCQGVAISIHYFFLASFFWMNVLAYDVHRTFSSPYEIQKPNAKRRLIGYNFYAWLTPASIVLLAVAMDYASDWDWLKPNYGQGQYGVCWISNNRALIFFFAAPLTLLLLINWAFFIMASFKIASTAKSTSKARENNKGKKKERLRLALFIKLALLMGLTWILGIISSYGNSDSLRYLYITVNGLQGVFIFLAFARVPWKTGFERIHRFVGSINLERSSFSRGHRSSDDSRTTFTHSAKV